MTTARSAVAAASGVGVGLLAALAAVSAAGTPALGVALGAGAASVALSGFVASLWLDSTGRAAEPRGPALVVFLLSIALGLMLGVGGHGGHGS